VIKGTYIPYSDDPKVMGKIAKSQIINDLNALYSDNQKTLKSHTKGLEQEVELREGEYDSEEIEDDEKHE
jgi:hypothetical protein